jgi:alpha-D-ribose 1-methylphosphonate 5-triphosphate synthase subunit PhnI
LFNIHEQEIIDRPEVADQRITMLKLLEVKTRELLIHIQKSEDFSQEDYNSCGPLTFQESREDRLQLIYRSRFLLS